MTILHTIHVEPLPFYRLRVVFNTGEAGIVDLSEELEGEMFAPLQDPTLFASAMQHPVLGTVTWGNGADLAPEFLRERLKMEEQS